MQIISVTPTAHQTVIIIAVKDGQSIEYIYSPLFELLYNTAKPKGVLEPISGNLNDSIKYIIDL